MSLPKNYYFDLYHHDTTPIVESSSLWGLQGEYVIDAEHFGYTNWVSDEGDLQTLIPNGAEVAMHIDTDASVTLDVDVVANTVEIGELATLSITGARALQIVDSFTLNGLMTVTGNNTLTNGAETALLLTGAGTLNLSGNGTNGSLGTNENRNAFRIGRDLTITTLGWSTGYIYADITNEGTITTGAGNLTLSGNTVENTGSIITGGSKSITLENAMLNGNGTLNGAEGTVLLNSSTLTGSLLKGQVQTTDAKSTLKNVAVSADGEFTTGADVVLQESFAIDGKVSVKNSKSLTNSSEDASVALTGAGTLNLSGDGTSGSLGTKGNRNAFSIEIGRASCRERVLPTV